MSHRILAIHAHPDDVEILAGGTLARLAAKGLSLTIATMTPGDCGSAELPANEIARVRRAEAAAAARHIGADYLCAEFRDLAIFSDDASRRRVVEILRRTRPDIVLTSSPADYMADHEATSQLVRDACFAAPVKNYVTGPDAAAALPGIPHLYFMDPIGGIAAEFYVDVELVFDTKSAMLAEHKSQRDWLRTHHGMDDYLETMARWTREAGKRAGVQLAEGFRQYRGHPYPTTPLLQELLGQSVV